MAREIAYPPLVHWRSLLKGVLGGSLLVGGLANPGYGLIIQAVLILFGFIILVDGVMVTGKGVFIVICLLFAVIAGAVTLVLSVTGLGTPYLIMAFILAIILYMGAYVRPAAMAPAKKPHEPSQE
jgi:hypothetical protein